MADIGISLHPLIAHLCYYRGMRTREAIDRYFMVPVATSSDHFRLPDMRAAVDRIERAVRTGETIGVFGDYDADGVCSTAVLVEFLSTLGAPPVAFIPSRFNGGYGLHRDALDTLHVAGVSLLLTVDCGISNKDEVTYATTLGMDVIITDHHAVPPELPGAVAVINAARHDAGHEDDRCLSGVGVAYRLAESLATRFPGADAALPALLDLVALATIADMAPLCGQNRHLVQLGLARLRTDPRPGLKALITKAGLTQQEVTAEKISFALAPRINAAGRMGDAMIAYQLLVAKSVEDAEPLAEKLDLQNRQRQEDLDVTLGEALKQASEIIDAGPFIVVAGEGWSPGLIGLVAGRLVEAHYRPVLAVSIDGDICRGSARSISGFDIRAALENCQDLLLEFGGHPMAAGCRLAGKDLDDLRRRLTTYTTEMLGADALVQTLQVDAAITAETLCEPVVQDHLRQMAPFGVGNHEPLFVMRNAEVRGVTTAGKDRRHARFTVANGASVAAIAFGFGDLVPAIARRRWVDIAFHLQQHTYNSMDMGMQISVKDLRIP